MQDVLELSPGVAVRDLCASLEQVAGAMTILRTRIVQHDGLGLVQIFLDDKIHWREAAGLQEYLDADRAQPMGLGQPLTRFALVKDETGSVWFVWTMHHAIYDGWTMRLIMDAVHRAPRGDPVERGPPVQSFIRYLREQDANELRDFWVEALDDYAGAPFPTLPPSVDRPVADREAECRLSLPPQGSKDVTTSTLIRASWALIVARMSGEEDVTFGATVSGRNAPVAGIDAMVAPTFATIPLRVKVPPDQTVSSLLRAVQQQAIDAIPFEQAGLHRIAQMSPSSARACMFQSLLVVQPPESTTADERLGTWQATKQHWFNTYALMLQMWPEADKLAVNASFDARVLEPW